MRRGESRREVERRGEKKHPLLNTQKKPRSQRSTSLFSTVSPYVVCGISLARKPRSASIARATLAPVSPAGSGQTRYVGGPPLGQHYGYLAG